MKNRHLYLEEWLSFRGQNQISLVRAKGIDKGQLSKLVANNFKRSPYPSTMKKIADFLGILPEDLWRSPFDQQPKAPRTVTLFDLEDWLNDPFATVDGKPATPEFKAWLRATLDQMVKK